MSIEITDKILKDFICNHLNIEHFGYLVVTDDKRLNEEALFHIKNDFKGFIEDWKITIQE